MITCDGITLADSSNKTIFMEDLQKPGSNASDQAHSTNEENGMKKNKDIENSSKDTTTVSGVDDLQSNSDGAAGTDRAGTAERKSYGDIELNKGLEAQAKDEES